MTLYVTKCKKLQALNRLKACNLANAREGNRTPTPFRVSDFESDASASSATRADYIILSFILSNVKLLFSGNTEILLKRQ